jgi:Glu-tRNA(Gln) amidotransferase subunit E-like FAD-binding protein
LSKRRRCQLNENEEFVKQLIGIALYRKKNYIPLWKKNEDYLELYNSIMKPIFDKNLNKSFSLYDLSKTYFSDLSSIEQFEEIINKYIPSELNAKIIISPRHFNLIKR